MGPRARLAMVLAACGWLLTAAAPPPGATLAWAYPKAPMADLPAISPGLHRIPGSTLAFTDVQLNDDRNPADWIPREHPPAPPAVAHGREGGPLPCAECHLYSGQGFIGSANLTGLSAGYIVQQVLAFRSGERASWQADRFDTQQMVKVARLVTDQELAQAAAYYVALPRRSGVRVVASRTAPVTRPDFFGWLDIVPGAGVEPIGARVIEVPQVYDRMLMGDPHAGVVDYVPIGAVARGRALVRTGGPAGLPCAACHGPALKGVGDIPPLAGRPAPYVARMLWDIKTGARHGPSVAPMQAPVGGLTEADIADIAAYLASLPA